MKNNREQHFIQKDNRKNAFLARFFKVRYSAKYDSEVWVFDPLGLFNLRERMVMFRNK